MHAAEIRDKVVQSIVVHQQLSGRAIGQIDGSTRPLRDVDGFDSLSGEEATLMLSDITGFEFPADVNAFLSEDKRRALSVDEIVENVRTLIDRSGERGE